MLLACWIAASACGAPRTVVVDTGQTVCYGNRDPIAAPRPGEPCHGQDAQYQGVQPAYRDHGDGTVTDLNTGLIWQKTPDFSQMRVWTEAVTYAQKLVLAGHDDWRLPTIKELYSLMNFTGCIRTHTPYLDTRSFDFRYPDTSQGLREIDAQYWSSTLYVGTIMQDREGAFGVNFADGRIKCYPTERDRPGGQGGGPGFGFGVPPGGRQGPPGPPRGRGPGQGRPGPHGHFVRCVRGATGYGVNDFQDNGDGTVTDRATGLIWQQADNGRAMTWQAALAYAEGLVLAGHDDWRLPNAKELQSLVDYTRAPSAKDPAKRTAAIDPVFKLGIPEPWYWTGTTHGDNLFGVYVAFGRAMSKWTWNGRAMDAHGAGAQRSDPKSGDPARYSQGLGPQGDEIRINNYVRCVRGG